MMRAPLAPNGCPSETAPPFTFTVAGSSCSRLLFSMPTTKCFIDFPITDISHFQAGFATALEWQ